jgi:hypothetical protein
MPGYAVIENVMDTWKKEEGMWVCLTCVHGHFVQAECMITVVCEHTTEFHAHSH